MKLYTGSRCSKTNDLVQAASTPCIGRTSPPRYWISRGADICGRLPEKVAHVTNDSASYFFSFCEIPSSFPAQRKCNLTLLDFNEDQVVPCNKRKLKNSSGEKKERKSGKGKEGTRSSLRDEIDDFVT